MEHKKTFSRRLILSIIVLGINFIFFGIGMYAGVDLISVGTGLSLLNSPMYAYMFAETKRTSDERKS